MIARIVRAGAFVQVSFPFSRETIQRFRNSVPDLRWDPAAKVWICPSRNAAQVIRMFPGSVIEEGTPDRSLLFDVPARNGIWPLIEPRPYFGMKLYDFQKQGVNALDKLDSVLLADEMGLGKTVQAIAWASVRQVPGPTVVLCPSALKWHWYRELGRMVPRARVLVMDKGDDWPLLHTRSWDWFVLSYDLLARAEKVEAALKSVPFFSHLIMDEAHYIKNTGSQRARAALRITGKAKRRLALTGTPVLNRPLELVGLLRALGRLAKEGLVHFRFRYCDARRNAFGWDFRGASNLAELHQSMQAFTVRRLKKDVLKDLPEKVYGEMVVDLDNMPEYSGLERALVTALKSNTLDQAAVNAQFFTLRRVAAMGKVKAAEGILEEVVSSGQPVVVFCSHLQPLRLLRNMFKDSVLITGEDSPSARDYKVLQFQKGQSPLALCSTAAMGHGFTLTRAQAVYFLDLPWNPATKQQGEDRVHRIGQEGSVRVVSLLGRNTIDERMVELLLSKADVVRRVVDGISGQSDAEIGMLRALTESLRASSPPGS